MRPVWTAGIVLGVLCCLWTFVIGFAGWYKDADTMALFYLVIPIQIGVLIWGLRQTARAGKRYGAQVGAGTLISVIGGVIIFFGSLVFTSVAFPDFFEVQRQLQAEQLQDSGMSEADMKTRLDVMAKMQTPLIQAFLGLVFTVLTGVVASLIIAAFIRNKAP